MNYFLWFFIALSVLSLSYYYLRRRLIRPLHLGKPWKILADIGLALLLTLPITSMVFFRFFQGKWSYGFSWFTYLILGLLSFVITLLLVRDSLWLAGRFVGKISAFFTHRSNTVLSVPHNPSRRDFLIQTSNLGVIGVSGILTGYGVYEARRKPGIVNINVPVPRLLESFHGFKIVQITDIHAGLTVREDWIQTIAEEVNRLGPDLVAFTGDLADGTVLQLRNDVAPLKDISAASGKFFVTGNHEYYSGAEPWVEELDRLGFTVLLNENRLITKVSDSIAIAGITDYSAGQFVPHHLSDPEKAARGIPADQVKILLAHQPRSLYAAAPFGFDLILSGHTHGGQFFPWNLLATLGQPYISGLHQYQSSRIYVSRGTGYWGPPVRLGARSEITVITLTKETIPQNNT